MSDTSKATLRPLSTRRGKYFLVVDNAEGSVYATIHDNDKPTFEHERIAEEVVEAVNSYNPERDKLARELAEMVIAGAGCNLSDCACGGSLTDFARRLLKLYEEEKP